jgi:hypothetical protein
MTSMVCLSTKETLDIIIAIGTLLAALFAGISAIVAAKAARDTTVAVKLQREAIRAQTFMDTLSYEREIDFSSCMDIIRELNGEEYQNYSEFCAKQPKKEKQIRKAVDFLNHLAHLTRHGYVTPKHILVLYTASIEACREKLLGQGKWLDSFRKNAKSPKYYLNFECLCNNLENLWLEETVTWPDHQIQATEEMGTT